MIVRTALFFLPKEKRNNFSIYGAKKDVLLTLLLLSLRIVRYSIASKIERRLIAKKLSVATPFFGPKRKGAN